MSVVGQNILAGASGAGDYTIDQSCRFNAGTSTYLSRTPASASNQKTWTFSAWVKRSTTENSEYIFASTVSGTDAGWFTFEWRSTGEIALVPGYNYNQYASDQYYRDPGAWYHLVLRCDTTQSTWATRLRLYVNNELQTIRVVSSQPSGEPGVDADFGINQAGLHTIGKYSGGTKYLNGYLAEIHHVDGQSLTPSDFAETNLLTNQWVPKKYEGTYGTNGFYLTFEDSAALGDDTSGNGNDWTSSGLAATDQMTDTPTNNWCTMNPLIKPYATLTYSEGNLQINKAAGSYAQSGATISLPNSGKWYWEMNRAVASGTGWMGIAGSDASLFWNNGNTPYLDTTANCLFYDDAKYYVDGSNTGTYGATWYDANIMSIALNLDDNEMILYKNGVSQGTATISGGILTSDRVIPVDLIYGTEERDYNFGQNGTFNGSKTAQGNSDANGIGDFYYAPPAGHLAICTSNLSDPSIKLPGAHFTSTLYTGNGTAIGSGGKTISGLDFKPDLTWFKNRDEADSFDIYDSVRGVTKRIRSDSPSSANCDAQSTQAEGLTAFNSDGWTTGNRDNVNVNAEDYVTWSWLGDGVAGGTLNENGTVDSQVNVNTTAGFSIATYTANGTTGATFGHGLSQVPELVMLKNLDTAANWVVYSDVLGESGGEIGYLLLNLDGAVGYSNGGWYAYPTATLSPGLGSWDNVNTSGEDYLAYSFHSVEGYSKVGIYTGNGNDNGSFIFTGFRPAFTLIKRTDVAEDWWLQDDKRNTYNPQSKLLYANNNNAEATEANLDYVSNGFKLRLNNANWNANNGTYLYYACAAYPFKYAPAR